MANAFLVQELRGLVQLPRLAVSAPGLARGPRGNGRPVVVLPGHGFGDATTLPLRSYLGSLGYRVKGWGLGPNRERAASYVGPMAERLEALVARHGHPVALVGQSLGGYVAREVARQHPELVSRVVTLGTPIFAPTSGVPLTRPVLSLYSATDQVVPPIRSIGRDACTTNVEIRSSHFTMGLDPDVWRLVANELARDG